MGKALNLANSDLSEVLPNTSLVSCGSAGKDSTCNAGDLGLTPGLGRSPGEGKGYPLQYSGLENSMDCIVQGVTKSRTRLSDFHFTLPNAAPVTPLNQDVNVLKQGSRTWMEGLFPRGRQEGQSQGRSRDHGSKRLE